MFGVAADQDVHDRRMTQDGDTLHGPHVVAAQRGMGIRSALRANPATSAPSHIFETWRNVAQTCLNIKEMGPERSRINVCDPI